MTNNKLPLILNDYISYISTIKGLSEKTVSEYLLDLKTFLKFIKIRFEKIDDIDFDLIDISDIKLNTIKKIKLNDLHAFIAWSDQERNNNNRTKARKVASLHSFFNYLHDKVNLIKSNPSTNLEFPKIESRNPTYLTLEESKMFLETILKNPSKEYKNRDYAIAMIFLNCGIRLSELTSINVSSLKSDNSISIIGKGNKERVIYLNLGCKEAIDDYLEVRPMCPSDPDALFISKRKKRLSNRAVQHMIEKYIVQSGLDSSLFSTHKLRHTAATLMYKYGNVDIRALKEILGHESVSTTQIYTHIDNEQIKVAIESNPLAKMVKKTK